MPLRDGLDQRQHQAHATSALASAGEAVKGLKDSISVGLGHTGSAV